MKTIIKTKTGRNIQEVISKSMAVIIITALASVSLNAQDLNYLHAGKSGIHETALAMVENTSGISRVTGDAKIFSASTETATEEVLNLESWMMNESNFLVMAFIETESESAMEIESWMTNESVFNTNSASMEIEQEEGLELESWMTDENTFNHSAPIFIEETESALVIENWMLTENTFSTTKCIEQPMHLEGWMISELTWK